MKIVGLTGKARAGKDTVAQIALDWCKENGVRAERFAFADPLKVSVAAAFGLPEHEALEFCNWMKQPGVFVTAERLEGAAPSPKVIEGCTGRRVTGRQYLQLYGTEAHRDTFGTDFWVAVTEAIIDQANATYDLDVVFLTDARFENEVDMVHRLDGEVWEVARPTQGNPLAAGEELHTSEAGLPESKLDFGIRNVGTIADLEAKVRLICEQRLEGKK